MSNAAFWMRRYLRNSSGLYVADGESKDLELDFAGLRYKQITGLVGYGSPRVYSESYIEDSGVDVYIPEGGQLDASDVTLTLYFFGVTDGASDDVLVSEADSCYHSFISFLRGAHIAYWDNVRKRKVMLYLSSAASPKNDRLYGVPYKEVEFKFKNEFGRSFALSDATIPPTVTDI